MTRMRIAAWTNVLVYALVLGSGCGRMANSPTLTLPPRPIDALGGAELARELRGLDLDAREAKVYNEITGGNVPTWLRQLRRVEVERELDGRHYQVAFWVTPDYLAVGSDDDYFPIPLTPQTAQRIADFTDGSLLTTMMVDAVWSSADVRLTPMPIPPSPQMTTVPVFEEHARTVHAQRKQFTAPLGALVAGHKKDVVLAGGLEMVPDNVAIYGWHQPDGSVIQPLYTGHTDCWVDYSHGIRLAHRVVWIDGSPRAITDVLQDKTLVALLSDEDVMSVARYPVFRDSACAVGAP